MKFIEKHWLAILIYLLLIWAMYTAGKATAKALAVVATVLTALGAFGQALNPASWVVSIVCWVVTFLWDSIAPVIGPVLGQGGGTQTNPQP